MNDLIARLEAATGPDRELDGRIWAEMDGRDVRDVESPRFGRALLAKSRRGPRDECVVGAWTENGRFMTVGQDPLPPVYTASIDAALTLVPDGYDWIVANINGQVGGTPYACVGSTKEHFGETPVLSLCIAALKARAAQSTAPIAGQSGGQT